MLDGFTTREQITEAVDEIHQYLDNLASKTVTEEMRQLNAFFTSLMAKARTYPFKTFCMQMHRFITMLKIHTDLSIDDWSNQIIARCKTYKSMIDNANEKMLNQLIYSMNRPSTIAVVADLENPDMKYFRKFFAENNIKAYFCCAHYRRSDSEFDSEKTANETFLSSPIEFENLIEEIDIAIVLPHIISISAEVLVPLGLKSFVDIAVKNDIQCLYLAESFRVDLTQHLNGFLEYVNSESQFDYIKKCFETISLDYSAIIVTDVISLPISSFPITALKFF